MYVALGVDALVVMSNVAVPLEPGVKATRNRLREVENPLAKGEKVAVKLTLPVKPKLLTVMVDVSELPAKTVGVARGPAMMLKSGVTLTVNFAM